MIFAANLKCNHTRKSFNEYAQILDRNLKSEFLQNNEIMVFPPSSAFIEGEFKFALGAQNFYPRESGSFTGEIGKAMLDEFGIKTTLIGHSERREILGESYEFLQDKFEFAVKNGWRVVFCIGESDITYMNGSTKEFLASQLENIDLNYANLVIAYEPIWAIGTGRVASVEIIADILEFLRGKTNAPLLYGGSVNTGNIAEILKIKECGGVLVGTASWDANNFLNLIQNAGI